MTNSSTEETRPSRRFPKSRQEADKCAEGSLSTSASEYYTLAETNKRHIDSGESDSAPAAFPSSRQIFGGENDPSFNPPEPEISPLDPAKRTAVPFIPFRLCPIFPSVAFQIRASLSHVGCGFLLFLYMHDGVFRHPRKQSRLCPGSNELPPVPQTAGAPGPDMRQEPLCEQCTSVSGCLC